MIIADGAILHVSALDNPAQQRRREGEFQMEISKWTDEVWPLMPTKETVVRIRHVAIEWGMHVALAFMDRPIGSSNRVQIGWNPFCNDVPQNGQDWSIRVLGYDIPSDTWIAMALMRQSD